MRKIIHHSLSFSRTALRCLTGLLLLSGAAPAQTETFTTGYYTRIQSDPTTLALPTFDPTLGTLESIDITLQVSLAPNLKTFNSTSSPINFTDASLALPIDFDGPGSLDHTMNLAYLVASGFAKAGTSNFTLCHGTTTIESELADPSEFALWESTSTSKVNFAVNSGTATFGGMAQGSGVTFGGTPAEWGKISVKYTYDSALAVPEPAGRYLSFLVAGAMLLIVIGRGLRLGSGS